MKIANDYYLIVDLEATCSDVGEVPRHEMEIIEIGAVLQSSRSFEIEDEFQTFISPVRHPDLTDFCTKLTGITQQDVAKAPSFAAAIERFSAWVLGSGDSVFCSWGDYDRNQFQQDCTFHSLPYPFRSGHRNLKSEFSRSMGLKKPMGISAALRHLGLKFEGDHHRGLDDARNIARIVRRVCTGC